MLQKTLPIFSYIFHPLFTAFYAAIFYFACASPYYSWQEIFLYTIQITLLTLLLPLSLFFVLRAAGKMDSLMVEKKAQRKIPLLLQSGLLLLLITKSITFDKVPELFLFFLGGIISSLSAFLFLYLDKKVSVHMSGISALTCFLVSCSFIFEIDLIYTTSFFIMMLGCVASSRLVLKAHNATEIVLGLLFGSIPQIGLFYFWL